MFYIRIGYGTSELGAYQTITGSGLPSQKADLRLGHLSPCKRRAKSYHIAGVPRKKLGVQNGMEETKIHCDSEMGVILV